MKDKDKGEDQVPGGSQPDEQKAGVDRRRFLGSAGAVAVGALAGLSGGGAKLMAESRAPVDPVINWGTRLDVSGLQENFAPQEVRDFTVPPGGIDNLGLHSTDVFEIPGRGEFEVNFDGYFRVARAHPSSLQWGAPMIRVNIIDLRLFGQHEKLGEIGVTLNPDILAAGQIFPASMAATPTTSADTTAPVACRIAVGAVFTMPAVGTAVFNKEPILLMNRKLTRIPPVDDPSGHALLFRLPLFSITEPHGEPVAFLTSLKYGADHYLTRQEVRAIRTRRLHL